MSSDASHSQSRNRSIAIVGGGIAGMYCARHLASPSHPKTVVTLFEATPRFGGRIETSRELNPFIAEFGPMRFEPDLQPRFRTLCGQLPGIELRAFPGPQSPPLGSAVMRELASDERRAVGREGTALDLLTLGIYLLTRRGGQRQIANKDSYRLELERWRSEFQREDRKTLEAEVRERPIPSVHGHQLEVPLYYCGFWNALSEVLSHRAVVAIRDEGTFYHLIPNNPNAAEWTIWWLRLLIRPPEADPDQLATITNGVDSVSTALKGELKAAKVRLRPGREVVSVGRSPDPYLVRLRVHDLTGRNRGQYYEEDFDHVILALPKRPLEKLSSEFPVGAKTALDGAFGFPLLKTFLVKEDPWWKNLKLWNNTYGPELHELRDAGRLPVLSHWRARHVPTRELHYFYSKGEDVGMVMLYTDQPATEYWRHLLPPGPQYAAEIHTHGQKRLPKHARLLEWALVHYLAYERGEAARGESVRNEVRKSPEIDETLDRWQELFRRVKSSPRPVAEVIQSELADVEDLPPLTIGVVQELWKLVQDARHPDPAKELHKVRSFGLRDWAREPYGAGCHAWAPGVLWWELLGTLAGFGLRGREDIRNIHVCGEAYSDWHGFIEGALDSATDAMKEICAAAGCSGA